MIRFRLMLLVGLLIAGLLISLCTFASAPVAGPRESAWRGDAGWRGAWSAGTIAGNVDDTAAHPGQPRTDAERLIVVLPAPPLAVYQSLMHADAALTAGEQEAQIQAYAARLNAEQSALLESLRQQGLVQDVGRQFTFLVNAVALTAHPGSSPAIARLPGVKAVYPDQQAHIMLADSVPLIGAPAVWAMRDVSGNPIRGQGVKVAVVDTGIDYTHPDLGGCLGPGCKVIGGYDFINADADPMDDHSHGTHVAGIVAASGTVTGVAPGASLLAYKVCDSGGACPTSIIIAALEQAISDHADMINMSLSGPGSPNDPLCQATNQAVGLGATVVVAAGNRNSVPNNTYYAMGSPASAEKAVTVGASTKADLLADFSRGGPVARYLIKPDLVAPGLNIRSTVLGHGHDTMSGTSMASPHVAGAVALLKQMHPAWTPGMLKAALMNTARPLTGDVFAEGAGRVRVDRAAATATVVEPGSLSLGQVDANQAAWVSMLPFQVRNVSTQTLTYTLGLEGGLPAGANAQLSRTSLTVGPGQTQSVSLSLTVDPHLLPYPTSAPYAYMASIVISSSLQQEELPFAFRPPPSDCAQQSQIPGAECAALEALYQSTAGDNWYYHDSWLDTPPCGWYGIVCNGGHVTEFRQSPSTYEGNNLNGTIPPALGNLTHLEVLQICRDHLYGGIPPELGQLTYLWQLWLIGNELTGPIPREVSNLTSLEELRVSENQLSGSLPPGLGNLARLRELDVLQNQIRGGLPPELGQLTNLRILACSYNQFTGTIPVELGNLAQLETLGLYTNQLTGTIPPQLGNLSNLWLLNLGDNQLTGAIPPELGRLTHLIWLRLQGNRLSGSIPPELGNLAQVWRLGLENNALEGEIPASLTNLVSQEPGWYLNLGYNRLTATDAALVAYLSERDADWADTQTVPPPALWVTQTTPSSVNLAWNHIRYTGDGGWYEVLYANRAGGAYQVHGITADKDATGYRAGGLAPGRAYFWVVRSYTPPHTDADGTQQNALLSAYSQEASSCHACPWGLPTRWLPQFGSAPAAGGWSSQDQYPRLLADVNGDGRVDVVGFGYTGVYVANSTGSGLSLPALRLAAFGASPAAGSWSSQDQYPRLLADVSGDGKADIVGFGATGTYAALAMPSGPGDAAFVPMRKWSSSFGSLPAAGGWSSQDTYPRMLADMNADGRADIVGFGAAGVYVALSTGSGWATSSRWSSQFGANPAAGGWSSQNTYPRLLADVNGDSRADIVGCGGAGVYVALANAMGTGFGPMSATPWVRAFGTAPAAGGWTSQEDYPRGLADVNGDGKADIVGFGAAGVYYALATGNGLGPMTLGIEPLGASAPAGGWSSQNAKPRFAADLNLDYKADLVGFGLEGVYVGLHN